MEQKSSFIPQAMWTDTQCTLYISWFLWILHWIREIIYVVSHVILHIIYYHKFLHFGTRQNKNHVHFVHSLSKPICKCNMTLGNLVAFFLLLFCLLLYELCTTMRMCAGDLEHVHDFVIFHIISGLKFMGCTGWPQCENNLIVK